MRLVYLNPHTKRVKKLCDKVNKGISRYKSEIITSDNNYYLYYRGYKSTYYYFRINVIIGGI